MIESRAHQSIVWIVGLAGYWHVSVTRQQECAAVCHRLDHFRRPHSMHCFVAYVFASFGRTVLRVCEADRWDFRNDWHCWILVFDVSVSTELAAANVATLMGPAHHSCGLLVPETKII